MALFKYLSLLFIACSFNVGLAVDEISIHVQGLFKNTAIIKVNGVDRVLKVGKRSPEGILLTSANAREATIEYQGKSRTLTMGSLAELGFSSEPATVEVVKSFQELTLTRQADGMFYVKGTINNTQVNFLIDTGASSIAMNHHTANRIGIPFRTQGTEIQAVTASDVVKAYRVNLNSVRIGDLKLDNVIGSVLVGEQPDHVLLGMSFLNQFKVQQDGNQLIIGTRH